MEEFIIAADNGFLKITIEAVHGFPTETSHWGGYDTKSTVEIKSGGFCVISSMYISTSELYEFYGQLLKANETLSGTIYLRNYEHNLEVVLAYDALGHVIIQGNFSDFNERENLLKFNLRSDQTYIRSTLQQLKSIVDKYGHKKGAI